MRVRVIFPGNEALALSLDSNLECSMSHLKAAIYSKLDTKGTTVISLFHDGKQLDDAKETFASQGISGGNGLIVVVAVIQKNDIEISTRSKHSSDEPINVESCSSPVSAPISTNVKSLIDLGFSTTLATRALEMCDEDVSQAANLLFSGSISDIHATHSSLGTKTSANETNKKSNNKLAWLRFDPRFSRLLKTYKTDPFCVGEVLHDIGESQPDLLQLINTNPKEFIELVNESTNTSPNPIREETVPVNKKYRKRKRKENSKDDGISKSVKQDVVFDLCESSDENELYM